MADDRKLEIVVCEACGAKWVPLHFENAGGCPACHHPKGKPAKLSREELST